jgi:hypothetical protein
MQYYTRLGYFTEVRMHCAYNAVHGGRLHQCMRTSVN